MIQSAAMIRSARSALLGCLLLGACDSDTQAGGDAGATDGVAADTAVAPDTSPDAAPVTTAAAPLMSMAILRIGSEARLVAECCLRQGRP